jgi:hypothetical protein
MQKTVQRCGLVALALLLVIQAIPVERDNPPAKVEILAPDEVQAVLQRSCYDCHSNNTRWPWYAYVAPISWFVTGHVHEAREDLNLTEWPLLDTAAQQFFLGEMKKQVEGGTMPLKSYLFLHPEARLSDAERQSVLDWIDEEVRLLWDP